MDDSELSDLWETDAVPPDLDIRQIDVEPGLYEMRARVWYFEPVTKSPTTPTPNSRICTTSSKGSSR